MTRGRPAGAAGPAVVAVRCSALSGPATLPCAPIRAILLAAALLVDRKVRPDKLEERDFHPEQFRAPDEIADDLVSLDPLPSDKVPVHR